jgi:transposase
MIIAESYAGGETVSAVARRHGLTAQQLFGWRRAALRGADGSQENGSTFAPVVVEAARSCAGLPVAPNAGGAPVIEVLIGAATVRIPPGTDAATLAAVLRAMRRRYDCRSRRHAGAGGHQAGGLPPRRRQSRCAGARAAQARSVLWDDLILLRA